MEIFQYAFIVRALEAGAMIALIAPLIGVFLVLRRYALIADTLAHVSLAGVAMGLFLGLPPVWTALVSAVVASLGIEHLRSSRRVYGESALAIVLSGSLAVAIVLISLANGFNTSLFSYLFGSIVTVAQSDVRNIVILGIVVIFVVALLYKELVFTTFDEEASKVSGIPVSFINAALVALTAVVVAMAIPIVGVLLISALIVIPALSALQLRLGFMATLLVAEAISLVSVFSGIFISFYVDVSASGAIVLIMIVFFAVLSFFKKK